MKIAIAIFAKTIGLSPVKTRLAIDIGKEAAETFYRESIKAADNLTTQLKEISPHAIDIYWALAEKDGSKKNQWNNKNCLWTGEGCLGERMYNIHNALLKGHDAVMLLGSDCPALTTRHLNEQLTILENNGDVIIFGPCEDGGFYSFLSSSTINKQLWTSVAYSQSNTLESFKHQLNNECIQVICAEESFDVDDLTSLKKYKALT